MPSSEAKEELERLRRQLAQVETERTRLTRRIRDLACEIEAGGRETSAGCQGFTRVPMPVLASRELDAVAPSVNDSSPIPAKGKLFRSLFRGREDVFARL